MDPITIIVNAVVSGAAAGLQPTASRVVQDAYDGLKALFRRKYQRVSVEMLENDPADATRRQLFTADLARTEAASDDEVLLQAKAVLDSVREHAADAASSVGVKIEDLVSGSLTIDDIVAAGGGVDLRKVRVDGDVRISGVRAGQPPDPTHPQIR